jgi:DNA invertase Pin-like site-specific DNA recombinase
MSKTPVPSGIAYSYLRLSNREQARGDSVRRQHELRDAWLSHNPRVNLDASLTLEDKGVSGFRGKHRENPDRHALAAFLKLVQSGRVPRGSYLIVESLDRLSREDIIPALSLLLSLIESGVRVVQLLPVETVYDAQSNPMHLMMAIMELSRGHSESLVKSERVGAAWARKKLEARESGKVLTRELPAWVRLRGDKLELVPERAQAVKRMYGLATAGYGPAGVAKKLIAEGVPAFGKSGRWSRSYIRRILGDKRAAGEYQPRMRGSRRADGPPAPNYYPAVVTLDEWNAAQAGRAGRRRQASGRTTKFIDLFAGLVKNARDGDAYYVQTRVERGQRYRVLRNLNSSEGRGPTCSFSVVTFERAVLSCLKEIDLHEILNGDQGPDESQVLAGELAHVEATMAKLEAELASGDIAALARELRRQEARHKDLAERFAAARQKALHPLSASWGEAQSLLAVLEDAADPVDARVRLRSAIKRIVDSIWILVVPRGYDRLCAAQVWFTGGKRHRDYLILHRPPRSNDRARQEGGWWARSLTSADPGVANLDLRKRADAVALETVLREMDLNPSNGV